VIVWNNEDGMRRLSSESHSPCSPNALPSADRFTYFNCITLCVVLVLLSTLFSPRLKLLFFFRPHRSTTYVDAAVVTDRVAWSVGLSVTLVSPAKTAAPIEMPFGLRTRVSPRNHVLDGVQIPHGKGQF